LLIGLDEDVPPDQIYVSKMDQPLSRFRVVKRLQGTGAEHKQLTLTQER